MAGWTSFLTAIHKHGNVSTAKSISPCVTNVHHRQACANMTLRVMGRYGKSLTSEVTDVAKMP